MIGDLPSDPDWLRTVDPVNAARKKNVINLPVAQQGSHAGGHPDLQFSAGGIRFAACFKPPPGSQNWIVAKKLDTIQRSNQRLLTLVDMLGEVAGTLDRNHLLHLVTENAARLVDAERSSLFLVDPNTSEMIFQVAYQPPSKSIASSAAEWPCKTARSIRPVERTVRTNSSRQTGLHNSQEGEFSYFNRSAITVPLRSEPLSQERSRRSQARTWRSDGAQQTQCFFPGRGCAVDADSGQSGQHLSAGG